MFRKENGVTLVALVITIIVLLILAGVTITMALGEDGIVKQAGLAEDAQQEAAVMDYAISAMAAAVAQHYSPDNTANTQVVDLFWTELGGMSVFTDTNKTAGTVENTNGTFEITLEGNTVKDVKKQ